MEILKKEVSLMAAFRKVGVIALVAIWGRGAALASTHEWSPSDGSCVLGAGEDAVTVTFSDGALSFAGKRSSFTYAGKFLPPEESGEWETVLKGVDLDSVEVYSTRFYNPNLHPGVAVCEWIKGVAFPAQTVKDSDGSLLVALLLCDGYTKGAAVRLRQDGDDIVGRVEWAKYRNGNFLGTEMDFSLSDWVPMTIGSEADPDGGYGIDQLTFLPKDPSLRTIVRVSSLAGVTSLTVTGGVEVVAENGAFQSSDGELPAEVNVTDAAFRVEVGRETVKATGSIRGSFADVVFTPSPETGPTADLHVETNMVFTDVEACCIVRNMRLADVTNAVGWMSGANLFASPNYHVAGFFFKNDGRTATCQFQVSVVDYLKCVALEMEQVGDDIHIHTPFARYLKYTLEEFKAYSTAGSYEFSTWNGSHANVSLEDGYCITNLVLNGVAHSAHVRLSGACPDDDCTIRFAFCGTSARRIVADMEQSNVFPKKQNALVAVQTNATLRLFKASGSLSSIRVCQGGMLENWVDWGVNPSQDVVLDGGVATFGRGDKTTSIKGLYFRNGAEARGSKLLFAEKGGPIVASGDRPSFAHTELRFYPIDTTYHFHVDDVTGSDQEDFTVTGRIIHHNPTYTSSTFVKKGAGTMRWDGACTAVGKPTEIHEGVLLLGNTDVLTGNHALVFAGGGFAVADGTVNACGEFFLTKDASFDIGAGAVLSFADVGAWNESAKLTVHMGEGGRLRIGMSAGLTGAQRSRIRLNGARVSQSADGFLSAQPRALRVLIR